ncbi:serine hydrolase [Rivibacter subsaxonicus]|uniref:CubicO group peptidase (Beta-lactamase class C family) n=1 Tax=Rivibacter subsaxonicus TaxID=457575 RepID=A0A4Q7VCB9_9BURK|nr:serine hydrolase [Rivibacter subsaxonicus]RZT92482.1 CubicO group peptidase (beta-lactamase class C family) [Rivibacter subsaxonicus]
MDFVAYHHRSGAEHQAQFTNLYPQGYRLISLSVYQPNNPLYAAVWVRRGGPDWSAVHGLDAAGYQAAFNNAAAAGFHPVILSVAGTLANPVIAGVFEQRPGPVPLTRVGLRSGSETDAGTIQHWDKQAHDNRWIMTSGAIYGDAATPAYAGIWPANSERVAWSADGIGDDHATYQQRFDAQLGGHARLAHAAVSGNERYLSIYRDDQIGPVVARHGLTSAGYQAEFDRLVPLGYYPICVQGGGSGAGIRFAAIFAKQEAVLQRQWTVSGAGTAQSVDDAMRGVLEAAGVRSASLAVVRNTRLVFARGYTWAEPGYPVALPTTLFRLASVSKSFVAVAAHQLIDEGRLRLTDTVQGILGLTTPAGLPPTDPGFAAITVEDLLLHRSRLVPDFYWSDAAVAAAFGTKLPVSEAQLASFKCSQMLQAAAPDYNNWGYALLGMVVARVRGAASFFDALRTNLLEPLQITRMRTATSLAGASFADEARYHRSGEAALRLAVGRSVMTADQPLVADVYGNIHLENGAATGGLSCAAVDLARFIAAFNVNRKNPMLRRSAILAMLGLAATSGRPRSGHGFDSVVAVGSSFTCDKGGYLWSSQNAIHFDLDGLGIAVCYAGVHDTALFATGWPVIRAAIEAFAWPARANHFSKYGMPAFG